MRTIQKTLCSLAVIAATSLPAWAADSVEVKVVGTIKAIACVPTLAGGGVLDYGTIKASDLKADDYTLLPVKSSSFSITCDAPSAVAVKAINNRAGTLAGATEGATGAAVISSVAAGLLPFGSASYAVVGLGNAENSAKIGGYAIRISTVGVTADATAVDTLFSTNDGAGWFKTNAGGLFNGTSRVLASWAKAGTTTPVPFKTLSATLEVQPYINKASALDLTKPITLDGSTTLELVYL